jgi:hypothetical protein
MELKLKERRFESSEEVQAESQDAMKMMTRNDFRHCFRSCKSHWERYNNAEGDYFEGNTGD